MSLNHKVHVLAFDADDTLWSNEPIFQKTQSIVEGLLRSYLGEEDLEPKLYATERKTWRYLGMA